MDEIKYCAKCGKEIQGVSQYCPDCESKKNAMSKNNETKFLFGWFIFGIIFTPLISIIVGSSCKKTNPSKSKSIMNGATTGIIIFGIIRIIANLG